MADEKRGIEAFERLVHGDSAGAARGTCKKCGGLGHLTYECKNSLKVELPRANALTRRDPFADEKARLRAEIAQLKKENSRR
ncbi:hypothetical protein IWQ57_004613, partial [Coemansia nantahalensis]